MHIHANIILAAGDDYGDTPAETAEKILVAVGGKPESDYCTVIVSLPSVDGAAGTPPAPPDITPPPETPPNEPVAP